MTIDYPKGCTACRTAFADAADAATHRCGPQRELYRSSEQLKVDSAREHEPTGLCWCARQHEPEHRPDCGCSATHVDLACPGARFTYSGLQSAEDCT